MRLLVLVLAHLLGVRGLKPGMRSKEEALAMLDEENRFWAEQGWRT